MLAARGSIDQDLLADAFARRYAADRYRGYGGTAHDILAKLAKGGADWRAVAGAVFDGKDAAHRADRHEGQLEARHLEAEQLASPDALRGS